MPIYGSKYRSRAPQNCDWVFCPVLCFLLWVLIRLLEIFYVCPRSEPNSPKVESEPKQECPDKFSAGAGISRRYRSRDILFERYVLFERTWSTRLESRHESFQNEKRMRVTVTLFCRETTGSLALCKGAQQLLTVQGRHSIMLNHRL